MADDVDDVASSALRQLGYVNESDVDLILVLDAHRRGPLTRLLFDRAGLPFDGDVTASRSTSRNAGARETDVEIRAGEAVLFVEDKLDAPFTDGQAESYRAAVNELTAGGTPAAAVLVCPARQAARYVDDGSVFVPVSFEELADVADAAGDPLSVAAALVLRAATQPRPGRPDDPLTQLWGEAYRAAVTAAANEAVTFAKTAFRTANTDWVKLGLVGVPDGFDGPWHWLSRGVVAMYLTAEPSSDLPGGTVTRSGKGWRADLPVPAVNLDRPVEDQGQAIGDVVGAAQRLRDWSAAAR